MLQLPIYLDNNASTACDPRVLEAMLPYFSSYYGNAASSQHAFGWQAEEAVDLARERVAHLLGAETKEIIFTSGATESVNLALKGVFEAYRSKGNHMITICTEHKAVLDSCRHLEKMGAAVSYLPVDAGGLVDLDLLEAAIRPGTILIAVMYANNETGVIQPIARIGAMAKKHGILFFTDATQAVGKIPVQVQPDGIDLLACSAHKIYGPKGVGALFVRRKDPRARLIAQMDGGGQERGLRSGTLNVPGIVGLGAACHYAKQDMNLEAERLSSLRDRLEAGILQISGARTNGSRQYRLPHMCNIAFPYLDGEALLRAINKDMAVSSGSACTSALVEPSHVLKALGLDDELARSSLRFGLGRFSTVEEVDFVVEKIRATVQELRQNSPLWDMHLQGSSLPI